MGLCHIAQPTAEHERDEKNDCSAYLAERAIELESMRKDELLLRGGAGIYHRNKPEMGFEKAFPKNVIIGVYGARD